MTDAVPIFQLAGYRFARLIVDEEPENATEGPKVELNVMASADDPSVSEMKFNGRHVIELGLKVDVEVSPETPLKREISSRTLIAVHCIAGFVGTDKKYDGDLEAFAKYAPVFARSVYWLARQRVTSLLSMTKLRNTMLPMDFLARDEPQGDATEQVAPP